MNWKISSALDFTSLSFLPSRNDSSDRTIIFWGTRPSIQNPEALVGCICRISDPSNGSGVNVWRSTAGKNEGKSDLL